MRLCVLVALLAGVADATTYYVDATGGSDSNNGTATTRAWKTLSKVSGAVLYPGDSVLFKRGEVWRGQLIIARSGSTSNPITYGAYGTGASPVINGADVFSTWTPIGNNLYTATIAMEPDIVVFNGAMGTRQASLADVNAANEWYWASNVLTIYSASTPTNMEVASKHFTIAINVNHDVRIQDLTVKYGCDPICLNETTNVTLSGVTVYDSTGMGGIIIISYTAGRGEYNTIENCVTYNMKGTAESLQSGDDGCGIYIYGEMCKYNTVTGCIAHHCGHEGIIILGGSYNLVKNSTVYQCSQSGFRVALETCTGNILEGDVAYENGQTVDDRFGIDLIRVGNDNIVRYCLAHDQHDTLNDPTIGGNDGYPKYGTGGIRFDGGNWADHDYMGSTGNKIYYCVVYNETTGIESYNFSNIEMYNNVVSNTRLMGMGFVSASSTVSSNNVAKNNIIYAGTGTIFTRYQATGSIIDYNVYYASGSAIFNWAGAPINFTAWKTASGQDSHSQFADPLWVDRTGHDFHLQAASPAVDRGTNLGFTRDYDNVLVPQRSGVDVGAYELPAPTVTVTVPNGGESYATGQTVPIAWTYTGDFGANVKIELLQGATATTLAASVSAGSGGAGSWSWAIPLSQAAATNYRIRVTGLTYGATDTSNADFTITAPTITVVSPNGGESWSGGETHAIQWTYTGSPGSNVQIELLDGATPTVLAASVSVGSGGAGSWNWTIPAGQASGSVYKIRVTSTTNAYCTDSSDGNFGIGSPTLTVNAPNGGEVWVGGEVHTLQWTYTGNPGSNVQIELLNGATPTVLAASVSLGSGGSGSYSWTIPADQADGTAYRVRVTSTTTTSVTDTSNANFTIHPAAFTVVSANGGEVWYGGDSHTLQWTYTGNPGANVKIELLKNGVPTTLAASVSAGSGGSGSWAWAIPALQTDGSDYRIRITSTTSAGCTDSSNANFTIHPASITVNAPNGGETWLGGESRTIQWTFAGNPGSNVLIELLKGASGSVLVASSSIGSGGAGSWSWSIPPAQADGSDYRVRITSVTVPGCTDTSNANFTIHPASITVAVPNGGEVWTGGEVHSIQWSYTGNPGSNVMIELLNGGTPTVLAPSVSVGAAGSGSWSWTVPVDQTPGSAYRVRVTSTFAGACTDTSNGDFTIVAPAITVTAPNGGEMWMIGETHVLTWTYTGEPGPNVKIELLDGTNATVIEPSVPIGSAGSGSWNWQIPLGQAIGTNFRVRITSTDASWCVDSSENEFKIDAAPTDTLLLNVPNGGETWTVGENHAIEWTYTGDPGTDVQIELLDNGVPTVLAASVPVGSGGSGSWNWAIPSAQPTGSNYRVRITSLTKPTCTDTSFADFTIASASITVASANGGETWIGGETHSINWTYTGDPGANVKIELLNGATPAVLAASVPVGAGGVGSWNWTIPTTLTPGSNFTIRVTSTTNALYLDSSDAPFTILATGIVLSVPNGGESWMGGETRTISWTYTGYPGATVKLELLNGMTPTTLATGISLGSSGSGSWSWSIPLLQTPGSNYRVRITSEATPSCADTSNDAFTITAPAIVVTSPNGGESWIGGQTKTIQWSYGGDPGANVQIELLDNGTPSVLAASVPVGSAGSGSWSWTIPASQPAGSNYRIRVTSVTTPSFTDTSNADFTISAAAINVVAPDGGEIWYGGETHTVNWTYTGEPGSTVKIELLNNGVPTTIAPSVAIGASGSGSWNWTVPTSQAYGTQYRIRVTSVATPSIGDTSASPFTILVPTIDVTSPDGGEVWVGGETHTISWTYLGIPGASVRIELLNGATPTTLIASTSIGSSGSGSWNWTVPASQPAGSNYTVRVTSTFTPAATGSSAAPFTIAAPAITVSAPNGGENYVTGATVPIQWTYTGNPGANVMIELLDGAAATTLVASASIGSGGAGSWNWSVPLSQASGTNYRVRVTSTSVSASADSSNAPFTITAPTITVANPNGGETVTAGQSYTIQWAYTGNPGANVMIDLIEDGLVTTLVASTPIGSGGAGSWTWQVLEGQPTGSDFTVRITSTTNPYALDSSDGLFTIEPPPPTITVTAPDGGEHLDVGETHQVQWSYTSDPGPLVKIELLQGGSSIVLASNVDSGTSGSGSWDWAIPLGQAIASNYRVRVTSMSLPSCTDTSNADFSVVAPVTDTITVTSPNGEENWLCGSTHAITWSYSGDPGGNVRIELVRSDGTSSVLVSSTSIGSGGTGSWSWGISFFQETRTDYTIRVTSTTTPSCNDSSDDYFSINRWANIQVEYPNGGEVFYPGDTVTLRWSSAGNVGSTVRILLLQGSSTTTLASGMPIGSNGKGSWPWAVPMSQTPATNYRIRLETSAFFSATDTSDANFTIAIHPPVISGVVVEPDSAGKSLSGDYVRLIAQIESGTPPFTVQWYKDGQAVSGATSITFEMPQAQIDDSGVYQCVVSNSAGSDSSEFVTVTVVDPLTILQAPQGADCAVKDCFTFSVVATGGFQPLAYEWKKAGSSAILSTESSLALDDISFDDVGDYYVIVMDDSGTLVQSGMAALGVHWGTPAAGPLALGLLFLIVAAFGARRILARG